MKQTSLIIIAIFFSLAITAPASAENATSTKIQSPSGKNTSSTAITNKDKLKTSATSTIVAKEIRKDASTTTRADSIKARKAEILKEIFLRRHRNDKHATSTIAITLNATTTAGTSTPKKK